MSKLNTTILEHTAITKRVLIQQPIPASCNRVYFISLIYPFEPA
jgi:hypothetical protein